ncbi:MAG: HAMP domain-containing sensor histidine kinase [Bifidobacteriaceae bacterium]|nr:HAMP domain-containing sensor histidine kinase [Bifidobacteriaceae bacterium]
MRRLGFFKTSSRPIGLFSSLKVELSILIVSATILSFIFTRIIIFFTDNIYFAALISLIVALLITNIFAHNFITPLHQMRDAAEAMAEGNYTARINVGTNSNDEIGQLARAFNEMAEELQHADQMRADMIANVSHELRTPVSAQRAMLENLADGVTPPTAANLESLVQQTNHLSDLIAFLLDLSRIEAGAASLTIESFNFYDFLNDTIEPLEIADGGHGHSIDLNVPEDIVIEGDQNRLRQLFTNIIANALKHSEDGSEILIETQYDSNTAMVITNVINFGSQISAEERSDIFRRYVKGKTGPGTHSGGTGLGLSIARWAAQLHNGSVRVVDDKRGVDFEIRIPKYHIFEK